MLFQQRYFRLCTLLLFYTSLHLKFNQYELSLSVTTLRINVSTPQTRLNHRTPTNFHLKMRAAVASADFIYLNTLFLVGRLIVLIFSTHTAPLHCSAPCNVHSSCIESFKDNSHTS